MASKKTAAAVEALVKEALDILTSIGIPLSASTPRKKARMAKALIAVAGMKPGIPWSQVQSNADAHRLRSREILKWWNAHLDENLADSSYDDIRDDLEMAVEAGIVLNAANRPNAKTNDGTRAFALNPEFAPVVRLYGTNQWDSALAELMKNKKRLVDTLHRKRDLARVPLVIGGSSYSLSPGLHNVLQKAIVEDFLPLFGHGAEVLYLGDTENKNLFYLEEKLNSLNFFKLAHDKLPDVVAYSKTKNWLFLIEAVDTANPITELRRAKFETMTENCKADVVYVTAFTNRAAYHKFGKGIAWETEVWIADNPEHMIHLNGEKFLGPYKN